MATATTPHHTAATGEDVFVAKGDKFDDNDPLVQANPQYFTLDAPAEPAKRGPGRPRKDADAA